MRQQNPSTLLLLGLAGALVCGCGPTLSAHEAYGVWQGTQDPGAKRVQITFIAPDKVELKYPDEKDAKVSSASWKIDKGRLLVTGGKESLDLGLSGDTVNEEAKLKLTSKDGKFKVWKL